MNFGNVINVVALILGLPSALLLFTSGQVVIGVLVVLLVVVVIGGVLFLRWYDRQPNITLVSHEKTLTLDDKDGHSATQVSKMRLRANRNGVARLRVGAVRGDGPIENILIDGNPPTDVQESLGGKEVYKAFRPPLGRGEVRDMEVSLKYEDSYKEPSESWTHPIALKTKKLSVKILFPPDRTCANASATVAFAGEVHEWMSGQVEVSRDRREAKLEISKPRLGAEYELHWEW